MTTPLSKAKRTATLGGRLGIGGSLPQPRHSLEKSFQPDVVMVYGIALEELKAGELDLADPEFPILVAAALSNGRAHDEIS